MMGSVTYEGVTFVAEECLKMGRDEFVKTHAEAFWPDKEPKVRRKMLAEVYSLMAPSHKEKKEE